MNHDELPLKPVAEKDPSTEATVWLCGECRSYRRTRAEADACCVCRKCRKNVLRTRHGSREMECEACTIKGAVRYAQESIRRNKKDLRSSEQHLAKLRERKAQLQKAQSKETDR